MKSCGPANCVYGDHPRITEAKGPNWDLFRGNPDVCVTEIESENKYVGMQRRTVTERLFIDELPVKWLSSLQSAPKKHKQNVRVIIDDGSPLAKSAIWWCEATIGIRYREQQDVMEAIYPSDEKKVNSWSFCMKIGKAL